MTLPQAQVNALQGQVNQLKTTCSTSATARSSTTSCSARWTSTRTLYEGLLHRYKEIGVAGGITTNNISVVDRRAAAGRPSQPQPMRNLAVAGMAGLAAGVMLAFLLETLDQAVRKPADVESKLGLPVLGSVPLLEKGVQPLEALADLRSPFSEAYHSIRSNLAFSTKDGAPKVLSITSARPEEGKSTTAFALAQGFARAGMRVLLVDLDLRNPSQHKIIGADNRVGASSLLTGAVRLQGAVQPTDWPNLFLIPSGPLPPSPAELLIGPRLVAFDEGGHRALRHRHPRRAAGDGPGRRAADRLGGHRRGADHRGRADQPGPGPRRDQAPAGRRRAPVRRHPHQVRLAQDRLRLRLCLRLRLRVRLCVRPQATGRRAGRRRACAAIRPDTRIGRARRRRRRKGGMNEGAPQRARVRLPRSQRARPPNVVSFTLAAALVWVGGLLKDVTGLVRQPGGGVRGAENTDGAHRSAT